MVCLLGLIWLYRGASLLIWLSLDIWLVSFLSLAYLLLLFIVANKGQKETNQEWLKRPWVYSLSLGVSCTSWAFYGTVGQAASTGAWLAPVYIGSILCFVLAWPMLLRMLRISKQQNITSIADLIACRYDRSPQIAAVVTIVALLGSIPYIALQLRAISKSFDLSTGHYQSGVGTTIMVTIVLILFSILFGARQSKANKQNQGLVLAMAFSSMVKLFALSAVGIFVTFFVFDGLTDLFTQTEYLIPAQPISNSYFAISQAILGMITIFVLPQQYHMMVIENHHERELKTARWLYPFYLVLINLFILPIALAGQHLFPGGSVDADTYVITIPLYFQQSWLVALVYIGGLAAATSMVIVATIVLSTMVTTEVVNPLLLRYNRFVSQQKNQLANVLLNLRRIAIVLLLVLAFGFERLIDQQDHLATIGLLSFVLLAQTAPLVIGALYWRKATTKAALTGLSVGSLIWLYTLLLPTLMPDDAWLSTGPLGLAWLRPQSLFGISSFDPTSHGLLFSLLINTACYVGISLLTRRSVGEKLQAELFLNKQQSSIEQKLTNKDLYQLLHRFIGNQAAEKFSQSLTKLNKAGTASNVHIEQTRLQLSSVLGSASTRMVMKAASKQQTMPLEDVVSIVDEANELFQFNRELLQAGVENIEQGISVVDADMRLVAWNRRYIELLDYPDNLVTAGKPIADLIRFNAERGYISGDECEALIERRLSHMRQGSSHHYQREMPRGLVIEIRGQAMPGGGFVSTFSDITSHIEAENVLKRMNEDLEQRVQARTVELTQAKADAEAAHVSKTKFLAAASHDLMQPFNALSLFSNMLSKKLKGSEFEELVSNIENSLQAADNLLSDLVEISKLDSSSLKVNIRNFSVNELLVPLGKEFTVLAKEANLDFNYCMANCFIESDLGLLRRVVQNFLSNAINYCPQGQLRHGKVLLGVRRQETSVRIEVWDNGPGIPQDKQQDIFVEFERLAQSQDKSGLGLGLAISDRIAKLLGLNISVQSRLGKGSCFSITIPRHQNNGGPQFPPFQRQLDKVHSDFTEIPVLLIDNEPLMLTAMETQLMEWGCQVVTANDEEKLLIELAEKFSFNENKPALIISDYHLNDKENGVDVIKRTLLSRNWQIPVIICSADPSEQVREHTQYAEFNFMRKPIKALALKKQMRQLLNC